MNARTYAVGGGVLDAPRRATYIVPLRPGDRQKSTFYRRGVQEAAPYGIVRGVEGAAPLHFFCA